MAREDSRDPPPQIPLIRAAMLVNLDYQPAVAQRAGIGRYTRLLAHYLPAFMEGDDALRLFYLDFTRRAEPPEAIARAVPKPWRLLPGKVIQQLWKRGLPPRYDLLSGRADIFHFPNFIIPPVSKKAKTAVTIFDMSFMRHPECAEARNLAYMTARIGETVKRADAIITISKFSADETEAFFPEAKGKTHPLYLGLDQTLLPPPPETVAETRKRLGLDRPYILSVGTIEPRKNFAFLVDVFERLGRDDIDLVIVGRPGWKCEPTLEKFRTSKAAKNIRHFASTGDGDLAALYAGASVFALASLYEGFGFPPLEAMQCGAPVVSSDGGSLPEVLGEAAEIVHGFDADTWAAALARMLGDKGRRAEFATRGKSWARRYRWEDTARQTYAIYKGIAGGPA